ncbi:tripartite tricarboxylate transporter substrate binding protein [Roseococcus sp. SYP-B2431]|uniref:Bug family tripartite tricarboxylate transporter substrate binding protein n=1 Tax=Roseococcus sp. SYP-B2431 TaxID=2496640 RepID=UPI00103C6DB8|nr:tripartite tricarboxylate transporter substrate binding protein [Roseococcus sp. SYP-B2431]TCH97829.1 tripartite tricarboxylate transporter substrate binding protein [Roseococcus sp. SYP-B2431]
MSTNINRRALLTMAGTTALAAPALAAFPDRPVRIIVPWPPGALADVVMRALAQHMPGSLGQPVVVENRPGATGALGTEFVARSAPDGHTLILGNAETHAINPLVYRRLAYNPADFQPVSLFARAPFALAVNQGLGVTDLAGFLAKLRAQPGRVSFASWGVGSTSHLTMELLLRSARLEALHAPFTGQAPGITAVIAGQVDSMFLTAGGAEAAARDGRVKLLAVSSAERVPLLPEVPTLREAGVAVEGGNWFGLLAPARTPMEAANKLAQSIAEATRVPAVMEVFRAQAAVLSTNAPEAFGRFIAEDRARWEEPVRALDIKIE